MRTPAQIARTLGRHGARAPEDVAVDLLGPIPAARLRRIVARSRHPHLRVHGSKAVRRDGTARWLWEVHGPGGPVEDCLAWGDARTHGEALAVGLAALETASVRAPTR